MITTIPDRERDLQAKVDALTEELERLRAQEPDAWMDDFGNAFPLAANKGAGSWMDEHKRHWKPLYRAAPPAQPAARKDCGEAGCAEGRCGNAGCLPSAQPSEPAPVPCCGKYETCSHACTPRGKWLGRREGRRVLAIVPPGYVLVPIEPTPEMIDAGLGKLLYVASPQPRHIYRAMIAAAGDNT